MRPCSPCTDADADADAAYPGGWCALTRARIAWMEQTRISCPDPKDMSRAAVTVPGLGEDAARTDNAEKVALQPLPDSLPLQSAAADAGPAHFGLTHGDALPIKATDEPGCAVNHAD